LERRSFGGRRQGRIESTLSSYNAVLNAGETAAVLPLYTEDGNIHAPYSQSAIGPRRRYAKAYDDVFQELKFNGSSISRDLQMAPTWAYVRTNSAGTTAHHSTGKTPRKANQNSSSFKKAMTAREESPATASPHQPPTK